MFTNILLVYDGSHSDQQQLLHRLNFNQWRGAAITLAAMIPNNDFVSGAIEVNYVSDSQRLVFDQEVMTILNNGVKLLNGMGLNTSGQLVSCDPISQIIEFSKKQEVDLIILNQSQNKYLANGWKSRLFINYVIEQSPCSILITKG